MNISEVPVSKADVVNLFPNNEIVNNNYDSIIRDFAFMHSQMEFSDKVDTEELKAYKLTLVSSFICGIITAMSPQSTLIRQLSLPESGDAIKAEKSKNFAKSLGI